MLAGCCVDTQRPKDRGEGAPAAASVVAALDWIHETTNKQMTSTRKELTRIDLSSLCKTVVVCCALCRVWSSYARLCWWLRGVVCLVPLLRMATNKHSGIRLDRCLITGSTTTTCCDVWVLLLLPLQITHISTQP